MADERLEARRHFRNGMSLIAKGQFDQGIAELQEAYAIKPHPNVLFNIARAYMDAGRNAEALDWYRRYLSFNPPDADGVRATIARLEAAQPNPEAPKQAETLPMPPPGPRSTPAPDAQALAALVERLEKAIARAESMPVATATPGPVSTEGSGTAAPGTPAAVEDAGAVPYEERVVTASRRAQSSLEAPNATSVITSEDIRLSGATSLVELLRRVPGADVMSLGVGSANLSLRGFNQRIANKVLVLIDGRTEYQDFLGTTLWSSLPIGLEEIDRIEVIRGPGSALYGANAMLGVVNIISRAPGTGPRAQVHGMAGGGNTAAGSFLSHGATGALRYRLSVGYGQMDKWSRDFADARPDVVARAPSSEVGYRGARGNVATEYTFPSGLELGLSSGVHRFATEVYPLGVLRNYFLDGLTSYGKVDAGLGPVKLKAFWNHVNVDAGPQYEPIGQRSLATRVTSHLFNGEALYSKGFELAGEHLVNVGVEGRLKRVAWDYQGPELREEFHTAAFVQDEWRPVRPLRLLASYRVDRHPLLDNGQPGLAHSPRVSAIVIPFEGHAFRASGASAFREPTFLESYTDLRVPAPGVPGASALTQGSRSLRPERLTALELGYRGEAPTLGIDWDLALYQNTVKDLIVLSPFERLPASESYDAATDTFLVGRSSFQNEAATYTSRGAEAGVSLAPVDGLGIKASAALQKVTSDGQTDERCGPCSQAPQLKLFGGLTYRTRADLEFGVDAAYTSSTTWIEREPNSADPTVIDFIASPLGGYTALNARVGYDVIKDRFTVAVVGSNLAGAHSQHPLGNRIERRVYATLTVTP